MIYMLCFLYSLLNYFKYYSGSCNLYIIHILLIYVCESEKERSIPFN